MMLKSAKKLEENGISYKLIELKDRAISVSDVIRHSSGTANEDEICKTIIESIKDSYKHPVCGLCQPLQSHF